METNYAWSFGKSTLRLCISLRHVAVFHSTVGARLTLQRFPELSPLAVSHRQSTVLRPLAALASLESQLCLFHSRKPVSLPSSHRSALCCGDSLQALFWGYYWAQCICFFSFRNHCPLLTFVQFLKTLVSYVLVVFSCLRRKCKSSSCYWILA